MNKFNRSRRIKSKGLRALVQLILSQISGILHGNAYGCQRLLQTNFDPAKIKTYLNITMS